jgi:hypothetical protein
MGVLYHRVLFLKDFMAISETLGWIELVKKYLSLPPHHRLDRVMMILDWHSWFKFLIGT